MTFSLAFKCIAFCSSISMVPLRFSKISIVLISKEGVTNEIGVSEEDYCESGYNLEPNKSLIYVFRTQSKAFTEGTEIQVYF